MKKLSWMLSVLVFFTGCFQVTELILKDEGIRGLQPLTTGEMNNYSGISKTGLDIVYVSARTGNGDIYYKSGIYDKSEQQITFSDAIEITPAISPDGALIAFASNTNGNFDIFSIRREGGRAQRQITISGMDEIAPDFSPDGESIAYMTAHLASGKSEWHVWVYNLKDNSFTQLGKGMYPKWSPDGKQIAYQKSMDKFPFWYSIWIYDLKAQSDTQIVGGDKWGAIHPTWAPNGMKLAFVASKTKSFDNQGRRMEAAGFNNDIWTVDVNGAGLTQLTSHKTDDYWPCWTKNNLIIFTTDRERSAMKRFSNIWMLRPE